MTENTVLSIQSNPQVNEISTEDDRLNISENCNEEFDFMDYPKTPNCPTVAAKVKNPQVSMRIFSKLTMTEMRNNSKTSSLINILEKRTQKFPSTLENNYLLDAHNFSLIDDRSVITKVLRALQSTFYLCLVCRDEMLWKASDYWLLFNYQDFLMEVNSC